MGRVLYSALAQNWPSRTLIQLPGMNTATQENQAIPPCGRLKRCLPLFRSVGRKADIAGMGHQLMVKSLVLRSVTPMNVILAFPSIMTEVLPPDTVAVLRMV